MTKNASDPGWGASTRAVWGGEERAPEGATVPPVFFGVTFAYDDLDEWQAVGTGARPGHIYARNTNPTTAAFEAKLRALEGAAAATSFATGMAAISNTLFTLLAPGKRVVSIHDTYGGTNRLFIEHLPKFGIHVTLCETGDHDAIEREVARGCDLLYLESPTNPTLKVLDIARLAAAARAVGATTVVDNTFATPINQRPLELGADLVIHSATKFLGGHSDALGGVVCGAEELVRPVFQFREINGAALDAMSAFLLTRGLKTLELRVLRQNENALRIARFLAEHPRVEQVFYPGLESHLHHDVATRQMRGFGGVLSFSLKAGFDAVRRLLGGLRLAHRAASLGSVGTLVGPPAVTSHVELTPEQRAAAGIPESLVRYSAGIENADDLIADLRQALASTTRREAAPDVAS
jgi:cystathionine gamma-synthase